MSFTANPQIAQLLMRSEQMKIMLLAQAGRGVAKARILAPEQSGDYKRSITAVAGLEGGSMRSRIVAKDFKAGWIEFGTVKTPAFAPLRRGAEAAGLDVESKR